MLPTQKTDKPKRKPPTQEALLELWDLMCKQDDDSRDHNSLAAAKRLVAYYPREDGNA